MSIATAETGLVNLIVNNFSEFNTNNVSVDDEAIFNYVQTTSNLTNRDCVLIGYNGFFTLRPEHGFVNEAVRYAFAINPFFRIVGSDFATPISRGKAFTTNFIDYITVDNRLGNTVLGAFVTRADSPLLYQRTSAYHYMLFPIEVEVVANFN